MTYKDDRDWVVGDGLAEEIAGKYGLPNLHCILLANRGITPEKKDTYLKPTMDQIPSFEDLYGATKAAKSIVEAIEDNKKIYIHGDFDADGICATVILWEFLYREVAESIGNKVDIVPYIPDRVDEGYGLSESSISNLIQGGADLVITVDCGIRDRELIEKYQNDTQLSFIVTDHHDAPEDVWNNPNYTIVHPDHPDQKYSETKISGSLVALLLVMAIRDQLGLESKLTSDTNGLDLAALSTVTDMMPLIGVNRALVKFGLEQINSGGRIGLEELINISKLSNSDIKAYHLGFVIGPRINASGRIGDPMDAIRLLATKDRKKAKSLAQNLDQLNRSRQELTETILSAALEQIDQSKSLLYVLGEEWSEGIIGLVAGKLMERFHKPVIVMSRSGDSIRGSARSLDGFNITQALDSVSDRLQKHGGHSEAAGFTLDYDDYDDFIEQLICYADSQLLGKDRKKVIELDVALNTDDIDMELLNFIDMMEPFGLKNRTPQFLMKSCYIIDSKTLGKENMHLKLKLKSGLKVIPSLLFNCVEDIEVLQKGKSIDVIGNPNLNEYNGNNTIQFMIKRWREAE